MDYACDATHAHWIVLRRDRNLAIQKSL
jgi:hypothetical protein